MLSNTLTVMSQLMTQVKTSQSINTDAWIVADTSTMRNERRPMPERMEFMRERTKDATAPANLAIIQSWMEHFEALGQHPELLDMGNYVYLMIDKLEDSDVIWIPAIKEQDIVMVPKKWLDPAHNEWRLARLIKQLTGNNGKGK